MDIFQIIVGAVLILFAVWIYMDAKRILFILPHKRKILALHEEIKLKNRAKGIRFLAILILIIGLILLLSGIFG